MVNEAERHELYTRLEEHLGPGPTSTLMSLLPPVGWADVARKDDLRALGSELRAEMATTTSELRTEFRTGLAGVRTEIADLRADLHLEMRRLALTLVGALVSISGITFAANALL